MSGPGFRKKIRDFFICFRFFSICVPKSCFFLDSENIIFIIFYFFQTSCFSIFLNFFSISVPKSCFFLDSENITFIIFNFFKKSCFLYLFKLFFAIFHYISLYFTIFYQSGPVRARPGPVRAGPHLIKHFFLKIQYFAYKCLFGPDRA